MSIPPEIQSVSTYLQTQNLIIPNYQRPYKWKARNVFSLLEDIQVAIEMRDNYGDGFKYRIGTIIIHSHDGIQEIVDGQQRTLTLLLLIAYLGIENTKLAEWKITNPESKKNLNENFHCIKDYFSAKDKEYVSKIKSSLTDILEVVVISVDNLSEAFQLFDSQNSRGKPLEPHDLLKAYHLREMRDYPHEMFHAVDKWEEFERRKTPSVIQELFRSYLFPIGHWTRNQKSHDFTSDDIDVFKGIPEDSHYGYARRVQKAMPFFQIAEPFVAGENFFNMVEHYLCMREDIDKELANNPNFSDINKILSGYDPHNRKDSSGKVIRFTGSGFQLACLLFKNVLLCYYDKFRNFDVQAVRKLFVWAYMLRVNMEHLGYDSVNKYSIGGENNGAYSIRMELFRIIKDARLHSEISNLQINIPAELPEGVNERRKILHSLLQEILGGSEK